MASGVPDEREIQTRHVFKKRRKYSVVNDMRYYKRYIIYIIRQ
jgi:hypothetical protein